MKKLLYFIPVALLSCCMTSCDLNYFPSDELNSESYLSTQSGMQGLIDGCYAMLKDEQTYQVEWGSGNSYIRHYTQLSEFPSDNICNSNRTTDPLIYANTLTMSPTESNISVMWWVAYKICFTCNQFIEKFSAGESTFQDQLLGEAYFLRALMHFHMVTMCAKPYTVDPNAMGVIIRNSTTMTSTKRATVDECYQFIVEDLTKAASLMTKRASANVGATGAGGYACKETAQGLLSRVYLYMGNYQGVINVVNEMGVTDGASAATKLEKNFGTYFANAPKSKETLLCVAHIAAEDRETSSIASMYLTDGQGWGEIYPSDPLLNLYERYEADVRYTAFIKPQEVRPDTMQLYAYFPSIVSVDKNKESRFTNYLKISEGDKATGYKAEEMVVEKGDTTYKYYDVVPKKVNGEYTEYEIQGFEGQNYPARVFNKLEMAPNGGAVPMYFVTKYSYQDNKPMLSSPVLLRWGEVVLNLAEAYARTGRSNDALDLVNAIRTRAGIPTEGLFDASHMHGYDVVNPTQLAEGTITSDAVVNVVLDERRMELAFEGHRFFDQIRNKLNLDRRYAGVQFWEIVGYNENRVQYPIPYDEISTSGIPQNPGY